VIVNTTLDNPSADLGSEQATYEISYSSSFDPNNPSDGIDVSGPAGTSHITASTKQEYSLLGPIFRVDKVESESEHLSFRVFETGGGDPAANGDTLLVTVSQYPTSYTWETPLDVREVSKVSLSSATAIGIQTVEDVGTPDGDFTQQNRTHTAKASLT